MVRSARSIRKTLDTAAENNETAALVVMRAAEQLEVHDVLRQQLLNVIHRLHQDADELREIRDDVFEPNVSGPTSRSPAGPIRDSLRRVAN
ncbi:hypothetical protein L3X13_16200 [Pseudomonas stutzeri]|jgi:hypothetical protein|nr:hypothetical protein [Stutzerimonas stutzeri]MCF6783530.1 hypothetical protein [Stutzerimonas stutzeri]MCF6806298.1 hypothetical protein [Stutzerimonas stutzeri]